MTKKNFEYQTENYPNQMSIDKHVYAYHITCVACDFFISK